MCNNDGDPALMCDGTFWGEVTSPTNCQVFAGPANATTVTVAGTYMGSDDTLEIDVQEPTQPEGFAWVAVATTTVENNAFSTSIGPFDTTLWAPGNALFVQVVDTDQDLLTFDGSGGTGSPYSGDAELYIGTLPPGGCNAPE